MRHTSNSLAKPAHSVAFEDDCLDVFRETFRCPTLRKFGRSGQGQHGIDLIGTLPGDEVIAVQCKLRSHSLSIKEVIDEVAKIALAPVAVTRYIIATTASRNAAIQAAVLRMSVPNSAGVAIRPEIVFWEDIEDEVRSSQLLSAKFDRSAQAANTELAREFDTKLGDVLALCSAANRESQSSALDERINAAFSHTPRGEPGRTIAILEEMLTHYRLTCDGRIRFRLHANIGNALVFLGRIDEAIERFIEAAKHHHSPNARAIHARALLWKGDAQAALTIAMRVCEEAPSNATAHAVRLQATPAITVQQARTSLDSAVLEDQEVLGALLDIARANKDYTEAEHVCRRAVAIHPSWDEAGLQLGVALVERFLSTTGPLSTRYRIPGEHPSLIEAEPLLTASLRAPQLRLSPRKLASAHYYKGIVMRLSGRMSEARSDAAEAARLDPSSAMYANLAAQDLIEADRNEEAMVLLERFGDEAPARLCLTRACLLAQRDGDGDREAARNLLARHLESLEHLEEPDRDSLAFEYVRVYLKLEGSLSGQEWTDQRLDKVAACAGLEARSVGILRAIGQHRGGNSAAAETARSAATSLDDKALCVERNNLAQVCERLGQHSEAVDCLLPVTPPIGITPHSSRLLRCAESAGRDDIIMDFCAQLRANNVFDRTSIAREVTALVQYGCRPAAISVLDEWIQHEPADFDARVWRGTLLKGDGSLESVLESIGPMPPPERCAPTAIHGLVALLGDAPHQIRPAVRDLAYRVWRLNPESRDAWIALSIAVILPNHASDIEPMPAQVTAACAVQIHDLRQRTSSLLFIEDGSDPDRKWDEIAPSDPWAQSLMGKCVGDEVDLRGGSLTKVRVCIEAILPKATARAHWCMTHCVEWFPDRPYAEAIHLASAADGAKTEPSESDIRRAMEGVRADLNRRAEFYSQMRSLYLDKKIPLALFATAVARLGAIEIVERMATEPDGRVWTTLGRAEDLKAANSALESGLPVVVDISAVASLIHLDMMDHFLGGGVKPVVARATLEQLEQYLAMQGRTRRSELAMTVHEGELTVLPVQAESQTRLIESLRAAIELLSKCQVVDAVSFAKWATEERADLDRGLGRPTAHTLAIAADMGAVLWSDDLLLAPLARAKGAKAVASTANLALFLSSRDESSLDDFDFALARLYALNYRATPLRPSALRTALVREQWNLDAPTPSRLLNMLGDEELLPQSALEFFVNAAALIWREAPIKQTAQLATMRLLGGLERHPVGHAIALQSLRHLRSAFGLDALAERDVRACIVAWLGATRTPWLLR